MQHKDVLDRVEGHLLTQNPLEAFLLQSAYIEGLVSFLAGFQVFDLVAAQLKKENKLHTKIAASLIFEARKKGLYENIEFLKECEIIKVSEIALLHKYRKRRNEIIHGLTKELKNKDFEESLYATCTIGKKIMEHSKLKGVIEAYKKIESKSESKE